MINIYHFTIELSKKNYVIKKYNLKNGLPTIDILDLIPNLEESISDYTYLDGTSRVTDIIVLKALAKKINNCIYLEIGCFRGESLVNVAEVAKECVSINLSDKELSDSSFSDCIKISKLFSKNLKNVTHIDHNSQSFNFKNLNKKFDLIFIDGDHSYNGILTDTQNAFKLLKDENSIIIWHDYGHSYNTINWTTLAAILDGTPLQERNHLYHISNTLCAIYTKQKYNVSFPDFSDIPNKTFNVNISAKQ